MNKLIFNKPQWCDMHAFIVEVSINTDRQTFMAMSEKELLLLIKEHFTEQTTALTVDVICSGHTNGSDSRKPRRQIKHLWKLEF